MPKYFKTNHALNVITFQSKNLATNFTTIIGFNMLNFTIVVPIMFVRYISKPRNKIFCTFCGYRSYSLNVRLDVLYELFSNEH